MVIGDKRELAFELIRKDIGSGEVYLFVQGVRVGLDGWVYDLIELRKEFRYEINDLDRRYYPRLFKLSPREVAQLVCCVYEDFEDSRCEKFVGFNIAGVDIDKISFFSPPYLFDGWGVCLIQADKQEKFFVFDEDKEIYHEVILRRGGVYSLIESLMAAIDGTPI
ncbi:hypothetical protein [Pseudomonas synxantha]|uniref:hypothetical protein n=1 Tax=Pseudomonas synxantha TaxID=47883 RepID=UPI00345DF01D